jgi:Glycosyltransferase family 87
VTAFDAASLERLLLTRRVQLVLIAAAILGAIIGLDTLWVHLQLDPLGDIHAYYDAGARLNAGQPLYVQSATTDDPSFYRYPPLLAVIFRPLATLPFEQAAMIWEGILLAAFVLTILRLGVRRRWTWLMLGWLAAPIAWSLAIGQAQVLVTLFLTIGSPWAVALATNLKLLPVLVAIYWLGRRDGHALAWLAAWLVGLAALSFLLEPAGSIAFLTFTDLGQVGEVRNLSPYAISPILWVAFVGLLALLAWRSSATRFGWVGAVVLSVLASPRLLMYQFSTLQAAGRRPDDYTAPDVAER